MAETQVKTARPDADIATEIQHIIVSYPPLNHDRQHLQVSVEDGFVTIKGHTRTPINRRYLGDVLPTVAGITDANADELYDDETIRFEAGRATPDSIIVGNVYYGRVALTGSVPPDISAAQIVAAVEKIPGVVKVLTDFHSS